MFLTTTNSTLELVLSGAVVANQLHVYCAYSDHTTSTYTPGTSNTVSNSTTPVTIVAAPASSTQRQINHLSIYNADTADATVTVRHDDGTNERIIVRCTIQPGETLTYSYNYGWETITSGGLIKGSDVTHFHTWPVTDVVGLQTGGIASTAGALSQSPLGMYLGRASRAYTSCDVRYRVTTGGVGLTWAEIAIAAGNIPTIGGNCYLTTKGYTDTTVLWATPGLYTTNITLSGITPGTDVWCLVANQYATDGTVFRATSIASNLNPGRQVNSVNQCRPSTMGAGTEFAPILVIYQWVAASFS